MMNAIRFIFRTATEDQGGAAGMGRKKQKRPCRVGENVPALNLTQR